MQALIENIKEYYRNGLNAEKRNEFNTSVTLFFKALATLCDLYIYRNEGKIPNNHAERFRILKAKYKEIYTIIDKDFPFYQDSYKFRLDRETSEMVREDAKKLAKKTNLQICQRE